MPFFPGPGLAEPAVPSCQVPKRSREGPSPLGVARRSLRRPPLGSRPLLPLPSCSPGCRPALSTGAASEARPFQDIHRRPLSPSGRTPTGRLSGQQAPPVAAPLGLGPAWPGRQGPGQDPESGPHGEVPRSAAAWAECRHSASARLLWARSRRLCGGPRRGAGGAARRCAPQTRGCLRLRGRRPSGQTRHYLSPNACGQRAQEAPVPHPYSTPPASAGPVASGPGDTQPPRETCRRLAHAGDTETRGGSPLPSPLPARQGGWGSPRSRAELLAPGRAARPLTPVGHYLARNLPGAAPLPAVGELIALFSVAADRPGQSLTRLLPALPLAGKTIQPRPSPPTLRPSPARLPGESEKAGPPGAGTAHNARLV